MTMARAARQMNKNRIYLRLQRNYGNIMLDKSFALNTVCQGEEMQEKNNPNEQRALGYIEGRLEGLATKEYVAEKIDEQTRQLTKEIKGIRSTQTKAIGAAVGIGFILSLAIGFGNLAVNLGWLQPLAG